MTSFIRRVPASSLYVSKPTHWLTSRFHFSFAEYHDPARDSFGVLRVMNDDLVTPEEGFGTHPHRDMEIVSYVVDGELTHKDSMGQSESLPRGAVQYMSAGTGVMHSEMNAHPSKTVRFIQIWIIPESRGLKPKYGSMQFSAEQRKTQLHRIVTNITACMKFGIIGIHQDVNIFVTELDPDRSVVFKLDAGRQAYMLCIEGTASIDGFAESIQTRDGVQLGGEADLVIRNNGSTSNHLLLVEMPRNP